MSQQDADRQGDLLEVVSDDDCLEHCLCCLDDNLALCGERFDAEDGPEYQSDQDPACVVCADLLDSESFCPKFGVCCEASFQ